MSPEKKNKPPKVYRIGSTNLQIGAHVAKLEIVKAAGDPADSEPDPLAKKIKVLGENTGELLSYTVEGSDKEKPVVTVDAISPELVSGPLLRATAQIAIEGVGGNFFRAEYDQKNSNIPIQTIVDAGLKPPNH